MPIACACARVWVCGVQAVRVCACEYAVASACASCVCVCAWVCKFVHMCLSFHHYLLCDMYWKYRYVCAQVVRQMIPETHMARHQPNSQQHLKHTLPVAPPKCWCTSHQLNRCTAPQLFWDSKKLDRVIQISKKHHSIEEVLYSTWSFLKGDGLFIAFPCVLLAWYVCCVCVIGMCTLRSLSSFEPLDVIFAVCINMWGLRLITLVQSVQTTQHSCNSKRHTGQ